MCYSHRRVLSMDDPIERDGGDRFSGRHSVAGVAVSESNELKSG